MITDDLLTIPLIIAKSDIEIFLKIEQKKHFFWKKIPIFCDFVTHFSLGKLRLRGPIFTWACSQGFN